MISLLPGFSRAGQCAGVLGLSFLLAHPGRSQQLTNAGQVLYVGPGATLRVGGSYAQSGPAQLVTAGSTRVEGAVQAAAGTTLELRGGELQATGDVTSAGTTISNAAGILRLSGSALSQQLRLAGGNVGQLVVDKSAGTRVALTADLTVSGGVRLLGGSVRTEPNTTLRLPAGATLSGESNGQYVQGNLLVTRAAVNAATGAVDFGPGLVLDPQGQDLGAVTVTRTAGLQTAGLSYGQNISGTNRGIDRIWRVVPATAPVSPVTVTLSWLADDDNGFVTAQAARLWRADAPAGPWQPQGPAASAGTRIFTASTTQLNYLTVSNINQPLPVVLTAFTAQAEGDAAWLRWTTASEVNSAYFEVEGSADGQQFRTVGRVAAGGTRTQAQQYSLYDPGLTRYAAPVVYYRLRQVDLDGTSTYSSVRTVTVPAGTWAAALWPNPAGMGQPVTLQLLRPAAMPVRLLLREATGRLLHERLAAPAATLPLPELADLPPGLYLLQVEQAGQHATLRIVRR